MNNLEELRKETAMASARSVVEKLIIKGVISAEFKDAATSELHRELTRRARRVSQFLAAAVTANQAALRYASII